MADISLRLYVNTGTLNAITSGPDSGISRYSLTTANNSFNATCQCTFNYLSDTNANGGIPANVANIAAGIYLARPPATS